MLPTLVVIYPGYFRQRDKYFHLKGVYLQRNCAREERKSDHEKGICIKHLALLCLHNLCVYTALIIRLPGHFIAINLIKPYQVGICFFHYTERERRTTAD